MNLSVSGKFLDGAPQHAFSASLPSPPLLIERPQRTKSTSLDSFQRLSPDVSFGRKKARKAPYERKQKSKIPWGRIIHHSGEVLLLVFSLQSMSPTAMFNNVKSALFAKAPVEQHHDEEVSDELLKPDETLPAQPVLAQPVSTGKVDKHEHHGGCSHSTDDSTPFDAHLAFHLFVYLYLAFHGLLSAGQFLGQKRRQSGTVNQQDFVDEFNQQASQKKAPWHLSVVNEQQGVKPFKEPADFAADLRLSMVALIEALNLENSEPWKASLNETLEAKNIDQRQSKLELWVQAMSKVDMNETDVRNAFRKIMDPFLLEYGLEMNEIGPVSSE